MNVKGPGIKVIKDFLRDLKDNKSRRKNGVIKVETGNRKDSSDTAIPQLELRGVLSR